MGCIQSKRALRAQSLHENLNRSFPPVAAIPTGIIEAFLLANNPDEIVAVICKMNNLNKKVSSLREPQALPFRKDNEGNSLKEEEPERHKPTKEESEKHISTEEDLEEDKATKEYKPQIIDTQKLMEGLEDGETRHDSDNTDNVDMLTASRTSGRLKSLDYFHAVEEYEALQSRVREEESKKQKPREEESEKQKTIEETLNKHKPKEEDSEEHRATEEDKREIISTWELMEGLADGETWYGSENAIDNGDIPRALTPVGRWKSVDYIHMLEEYEAFLAKNKRSSWDRNTIDNSDMPRMLRTAQRSKYLDYFHPLKECKTFLSRNKGSLWNGNSQRYLYDLGGKHLESVNESTSNSENAIDNGDISRASRTAERSKSLHYSHLMEGCKAFLTRNKSSLGDGNAIDNSDMPRLLKPAGRWKCPDYLCFVEDLKSFLARNKSSLGDGIAIDNGDMPRALSTAGRWEFPDYFRLEEEYKAFLAKNKSFSGDGNAIDNRDTPKLLGTAEGSKSLDYFHTAEEQEGSLAGNKSYLWDGNSKSYSLGLGDKHFKSVKKSTSTSLFRSSSLPPPSNPRDVTPISIHWERVSNCEDDWEDGDNSVLVPCVLQSASEQSEIGHEINSGENNNAEVVVEIASRQEDNHSFQADVGNSKLVQRNLENNQSRKQNSGKSRLHERTKVNELGGITVPCSPDFSTVGSLREWLNGGEHLCSPDVSSTASFGSYGLENPWSKPNDTSNTGQFPTDGAEIEMHSSSVFEGDKQAANSVDSGVCSDSSLSDIEREKWDYPIFDPELLASFEKALEELSEDEKCILQQIDEH